MAYSAEESSPVLDFADSCCVCNEEFSSDGELAAHLLDHAEEDKFKKLLAELKTRNGPITSTPVRNFRSKGPEFIKTSFVKEPPLRKKPEPMPTEPEVWEIVSDDDEPNGGQVSNPNKKVKLSNSFRLVSSVVTPNNKSNSKNNNNNNNAPSVKGPPFHCHLCSSVLNDDVAFREHLQTHDKPRPFVCHICKKSFAYKGTLRQHLHLHISEKSHECRFCHKKFSIKSVLRLHEESHESQQLQEQRNNNNT